MPELSLTIIYKVSHQYNFHYLYIIKWVSTQGNQSSFEILKWYNIWRYKSLVILFFSLLYFCFYSLILVLVGRQKLYELNYSENSQTKLMRQNL